MYKILAICGEAGTGKDTVMQSVLRSRPDFHEIISCTSRPIREGEKEGVNYYYYTYEEFADKILNGDMLESTVFNNWCYGTSNDSVVEDAVNIGVFNPAGIYSLLENPEVDLKVVRMRTDDKTRLLRQLNREEHPDVKEIVRRFSADAIDFADLDFSYIEIPNERDTDIEEACRNLLCQVQTWLDQGQQK